MITKQVSSWASNAETGTLAGDGKNRRPLGRGEVKPDLSIKSGAPRRGEDRRAGAGVALLARAWGGVRRLLTHSWDGEIPALKDFAPTDRPNSTVVFWTFRVMVGFGLLIVVLALAGLWLRRGGRLYRSRPFLRFALWMAPGGFVALLASWMTTEIGRQPWVVNGLLRLLGAGPEVDEGNRPIVGGPGHKRQLARPLSAAPTLIEANL